MSVSIHLLTREFLAQAHYIHEQAQPRPWSLTTFEDCTKEPYVGLVASIDGKVVGYALILFVVDEATLMDIAVDEACRGQGIAKALMENVIDMCEFKHMASLWLEVRVNNPAAISLYEKYQFEHVETRKNYYETNEGKVDALVMKRHIDFVCVV
ncbi:ribosomal protein S18-alanine N-acetyltransferase [Alteromonas sp. H39]|uniref:ribosomal protein S18-alanine N-acetyltransferase n=1 Tax=Alteromonas sp. H39 TaxID=3389876 RepID=UPI0039E0A450